MNRYLLVIALCLHSGYAFSQSDKYFSTDSDTRRYFRGAAKGTRNIALTTDLVGLALNGTPNIGIQAALSKFLAIEIVYGHGINQSKVTKIPVPYDHNDWQRTQTRIVREFQQAFYFYSGQMGLRGNVYAGFSFWQTFVENTFSRNASPFGYPVPVTTTRRYAWHFLLGSQRTILGSLQAGWEAGIGSYRFSGPNLDLYGFQNDYQSGLSFHGKVKLGYLIK